jgi:hypothetical protein
MMLAKAPRWLQTTAVWSYVVWLLMTLPVVWLFDQVFRRESPTQRAERMAKYPDPYGNRARGNLGQIETHIKFP